METSASNANRHLTATNDVASFSRLDRLQAEIRACCSCVDTGYIISANPVFRGRLDHRMMVAGQAPGERTHLDSTPYGGATGMTLRRWLMEAGFGENDLVERFYLTSVTKCFPGRGATGKGDRAPSGAEIRLCRRHLDREIELVRPELVLALGRIAATELVGREPLDRLVGTVRTAERAGHTFLVLPLPHPSGVSRWLNAEANEARLKMALALLGGLRIERGW